MKILENDIELLEQHLDGELDASAQTNLCNRLTSEKDLADALTELKSQRAIRQAAFTAMEPTDTAAQQFVWRIKGAMLEQNRADRKEAVQPRRQWNQWRIASFSSAAAACMIFGFMFGRLGHTQSPVSSVKTDSIVATSSEKNEPSMSVAKSSDEPTGKFVAVGNVGPVNSQRIQVPISDEYGHVVAWQTFDNRDQAKNFTEDMTHARLPAGSAQPKLVDSPAPQSPQQVPF